MVQERIAKEERISVPWTQSTFELDYKKAKRLIDILALRGYISGKRDKIHHKVKTKTSWLRYLEKEEIAGIVVLLENTAIVRFLRAASRPEGIKCDKIDTLAIDVDERDDVIKVLMENRLIYECKHRYFARVSKKTIDIMATAGDMLRRKRIMEYGKQNKKADYSQIYKLFDQLFE